MCPVALGLERCVVALDADATESNLWLLLVAWLLSSDLCASVLGKIHEDLSVQHTILVQVKNLWPATCLGLLFFALLLLLFFLFVPLLGKFLLP